MEIPTQAKQTTENKSTKILAGIGIAALVILAIWLGVQMVQFGGNVTSGLASSFSGLRSFFGTGNEIMVTAEPGVVSPNDIFTLSWEREDSEETGGTYMFSYTCTTDIHLTSPVSTNVGNVLFCNTPFALGTTTADITLTAVAAETLNGPKEVTLTITFTPTGADEATISGETTITIARDAVTANDTATTTSSDTTDDSADVPDTSTPTTPVVTSPQPVVVDPTPVNDPNGTSDLTIRVLELGTVTTSGTFTPSAGPFDPNDRIAIRLEVENTGTKATNSWRFEADLPTERRYTWRSDEQEGLPAGTTVEYILGFEDVEDDNDIATATITVDVDDNVEESNENNNSIEINISIED